VAADQDKTGEIPGEPDRPEAVLHVIGLLFRSEPHRHDGLKKDTGASHVDGIERSKLFDEIGLPRGGQKKFLPGPERKTLGESGIGEGGLPHLLDG
jgi:hypothetical protein